MEELAYWIK